MVEKHKEVKREVKSVMYVLKAVMNEFAKPELDYEGKQLLADDLSWAISVLKEELFNIPK